MGDGRHISDLLMTPGYWDRQGRQIKELWNLSSIFSTVMIGNWQERQACENSEEHCSFIVAGRQVLSLSCSPARLADYRSPPTRDKTILPQIL